MSNTLKRMSKDFEVCVVGQDVSKNQESYPDVKFVDIDINRKTSLIADGLALIALCRLIASYKPDIIHSVMPKAGLLAALAGFVCRVPIRIHTFTGQTWVAKEGLSRHFYYWLDRLINSLNTVCLTDSFSQSDFLFKNKIAYRKKPLPVLSKGSLSGVDVARFDLGSLGEPAEQLRLRLKIEKKHFVFAFIARKTRAKGAIDILNAFSAIAADYINARLLFVGPDEDGEIDALRNTSPELFENVVEVGHVNDHEVYLAITDVLCLPSYREGFGSIVIDAAAMGVPAIGSRIPGLTDSVSDRQTGLLFPAGDVNELVRLMRGFIEDSEMRRVMGAKAKARVEEFFSADILYSSLKQFYLDMASRNPGIRDRSESKS
jgi:glycosyltransferase involved in cell wall biosynthesis